MLAKDNKNIQLVINWEELYNKKYWLSLTSQIHNIQKINPY